MGVVTTEAAAARPTASAYSIFFHKALTRLGKKIKRSGERFGLSHDECCHREESFYVPDAPANSGLHAEKQHGISGVGN